MSARMARGRALPARIARGSDLAGHGNARALGQRLRGQAQSQGQTKDRAQDHLLPPPGVPPPPPVSLAPISVQLPISR